jgi:hypothetical protein
MPTLSKRIWARLLGAKIAEAPGLPKVEDPQYGIRDITQPKIKPSDIGLPMAKKKVKIKK